MTAMQGQPALPSENYSEDNQKDPLRETYEETVERGLLGWHSLISDLEVSPNEVPELQTASKLESIHDPLSAIIGKNPRDFIVRAAVLYCLQQAGRTLDPANRDAVLWWLPETDRETALRNLRRGWIKYTENGWVFTQVGQDLYQLVELLFHMGKGDGPEVSRVIFRALKELNGDPLFAMRGLLTQIQTMEYELEQIRAGRSSVRMKDALVKFENALSTVKLLLREVDQFMTEPRAIPLIQQLHEANARLMATMSRLSDAHAEVLRQHIVLPAGYTLHQITESLMSMPVEALADVGTKALLGIYRPRAIMRPELTAMGAASYLDKTRPPKPVRPTTFVTSQRNESYNPPADRRVQRFIDLLRGLTGDEIATREVLQGDPEEILMRFSLLGLMAGQTTDNDAARLFDDIPWYYEPGTEAEHFPTGPLRFAPKSRLRRRRP